MHTEWQRKRSFSDQQTRFIQAAQAVHAQLAFFPHPLSGPDGEALGTDVALVGNPAAKRFMVILSGTHGVEGYYGSDCQTAWLQSAAHQSLPDDVAVLLIHLINPWGTAWRRRVNEDNIDLNRNYLDFSAPLPVNAAYEQVHDIYACPTLEGPARTAADHKLAEWIQKLGWAGFGSITEAGQYQHADGFFYGGQSASWSNRTLHAILQQYLAQAGVAMCFDLHSGAGAYGHPMLMTIAKSPYPAFAEAQACFGPWLYAIFTQTPAKTDSGVVPNATGYTSQALLDALPHVQVLPMVIECGSFDPASIHTALRNDHWLHLFGQPNTPAGKAISQHLLDQFLPPDPDWHELVHLRVRQILAHALACLPGIHPAVNKG